MEVKKRPRPVAVCIALVLMALFFVAMIVFFIISGSRPDGRISSAISYDGAALLCLFAFFATLFAFLGLGSLRRRMLAGRADCIRLSGKVFVNDCTKDQSHASPAPFVSSLIPPGMLAEKEEDADYILDVIWSVAQVGKYGSGHSGYSPAALKRSCTLRILDCHSGGKRYRNIGEREFNSAPPPEKIFVGYGNRRPSIGDWPEDEIREYVRSCLP